MRAGMRPGFAFRPASTFLVKHLPLLSVFLLGATLKTAAQFSSTDENTVMISNPSFELLSLTESDATLLRTGGWLRLPSNSISLNGWSVMSAVRLYSASPNNSIPEGKYALLLADNGPGQIQQKINTIPGREYDLSFTTVDAGYGCSGQAYYIVTAGTMSKSFSFKNMNSPGNYSNLGFSFIADEKGMLIFNATSVSEPSPFCGVVIDAITVHARPDSVPLPGSLVVNDGFEQSPSFPSGAAFSTAGFEQDLLLFGMRPVFGWGLARPGNGAWVLRSIGGTPLLGSYSYGFAKDDTALSQTISTTVGRRYRINFRAGGWWTDCKFVYNITVYLGSVSNSFAFSSQATNLSYSMEADAYSSSTTLEFASLTIGTTEDTTFLCGPLLDAITVTDIGAALPISSSNGTASGSVAGNPETIAVAMKSFVDGSEMLLRGSPTLSNATGAYTLLLTGNSTAQSGRALFKNPFRLFDRVGGRVASFETNFTFVMAPNSIGVSNNIGGHGLTFLIVPESVLSGVPGGALGFEYPSTGSTQTPTFGVEFDTYHDPSYGDINGAYPSAFPENIAHHVGVNVGTAVSIAAVDLYTVDAPTLLNTGKRIYGWVRFDGQTQNVSVWLSNTSTTIPATPILQLTVDLRTLLGSTEWFYAGFSAATDVFPQSHEIHSWHFSSSIASSSIAPVAASPSPEMVGKKGGSKGAVIGGSVAAGLIALACACMALAYCCWWKPKKQKREGPLPPPSTNVTDIIPPSSVSVAIPGPLQKDPSGEALGIVMGPQPFTFEELRAATRDFTTKLGQGGQGGVFLGTLPDGLSVAVKVIDIEKNAKGGERAFRAEASTLGSLRHRNLCRLVGWCVDTDRAKLMCCYEYMQNGSLDMWLFLPRQPASNSNVSTVREPLSWAARYNIAIGLAKALSYLHEEAEHKIIHRDVKPGNIMLDETFNARLGDFGLAFSVSHDATTIESRTAAGTSAYLPPEVRFGFKPNEKWDVYAFGLVALELVSGRRAMEPTYSPNEVVLMMYAWQLIEEERPLDLVDRRLEGHLDSVQAQKLIRIALACTAPNMQLRPTMWQVTQALVADGDTTLPIVTPTTRPPELAVPDYVSNASTSWSQTRESFGNSNSDMGFISETSILEGR